MKNGILTQSELVARSSGLIAASLMRQQRRGRSVADRLRRFPGCAGDLPAQPVATERAGAAPAEALAVREAMRRSVDLFLLACEPWPGAAGLDDGSTAWSTPPGADARE